MSKPIVVIWQNGVNLFQDNTHSPNNHAEARFTFQRKTLSVSRLL